MEPDNQKSNAAQTPNRRNGQITPTERPPSGHDQASKFRCACGWSKRCPSCGSRFEYLGYDNGDYAFGHVTAICSKGCP